MYFHTDNPDVTALLGEAVTRADLKGRLRLDVSTTGELRVKVGEGMWSAPIASTFDPNRDLGTRDHIVIDAEKVLPGDLLTAFGNSRVDFSEPYSEFYTRITFNVVTPEGDSTGSVTLWNGAPVSVAR